MGEPVVTDRDHGYQELKRRWLSHRNSRGVVVGIFGEGAVAAHADGVTNLLLALVHEFGAPAAHIPSRSWLRAWVDENGEILRRTIRTLSARVLRGELAQDAALEQLGMWVTAKIRNRIANKLAPALAPSTLAARIAKARRLNTGSRGGRFVYTNGGKKRWLRGQALERQLAREQGDPSAFTPLIDSGQFWQAITHEVRDR